jgi:hypothetical protein
MPKKNPARRLVSNFTLGGEQAEADPLLPLAFFESSDYGAMTSSFDPRCFIIGRTGSGKSAALQRLAEENPDHVIRITPEDLSLPYITDLGVLRYLDSLDVHLDLLFIALWKHVLLVELIRHRYHVDSPVAKANMLQNLKERIKKDPAKRAALEYLDEFEGRFWCEADERVREITETFTEKIRTAAGGNIGIANHVGMHGDVGTDIALTSEERAQQAERFQRIVNETQLARLNKMLNVLDEDVLDSAGHYTFVVIDDLDRDWVDDRLANDLIRCLFRTVLDLKRVRHLKVLVGLRTNIFEELHFSHRAGGQEEKFRALALNMRWNEASLETMLDERVKAAATLSKVSFTGLKDLLPPKNKQREDAISYILDRTLLRPRDAISYLNECLACSDGRSRLTWDVISTAEKEYSAKRLLALRDEWKLNYPDIQRVFELFRGVSVPLSRDEYAARLDDVMLLLADPSFAGLLWLMELSQSMWATAAGESSWRELYGPLTRLLYSIGFIGVCWRSDGPAVYVLEQSEANVWDRLEDTAAFTVHPTFRRGLGIKAPRSK